MPWFPSFSGLIQMKGTTAQDGHHKGIHSQDFLQIPVILIDIFEIRISRGVYKNKYPFRELRDRNEEYKPAHTLTQEELNEIDELLKDIPEGKLRASFKKAIKAQKQNSEKK